MSQPPEGTGDTWGQHEYGDAPYAYGRGGGAWPGDGQGDGPQVGELAGPAYAPPTARTGSGQKTAGLRLDDSSNRTYSLRRGSNVVGRGRDADFRLRDSGVSRRHLEIIWDGESATLVDLGSANGTTVNGVPVKTWQLADGDVIRVGRSSLVFRFSGVSRSAPNMPVDSTVTIYTSSNDGEPLQDAVVELLEACGFEVRAYGPPVKGSWFRRLFVRSRDSKAADRLAELAGKLERAAELKYIHAPRSENDEREAKAIAQLAHAMEGMDEVVIRTSSVLFLKVDGKVLAWVLSEAEIRILDCHPELMRSPMDILNHLPRLRKEKDLHPEPDRRSPATPLEESQ
jgi:pSer/pThr/pTyr-binding forkhead associated (FHA) protein